MKRRIELDEIDFVRLMWVCGVALGVVSDEMMPIARQQIYELTTKFERESTLVPDADKSTR